MHVTETKLAIGQHKAIEQNNITPLSPMKRTDDWMTSDR